MSQSKSILIRLALTLAAVTLGMVAIGYNGTFAWFCFIPYLFAIEGLSTRQVTKYACIGGFALGAALSLGLYRYGIGVIVAIAIYTMLSGIFIGMATGMSGQKGFRGLWILFLPAVWVVLEFVRTLSPISVPSSAAISQAHNLALIQIASVTGTYGISFIIVLVNCVLYRMIKTRRPSFIMVAIAIVFLLHASSHVISGKDANPDKGSIKVAIVQGGIPIERYRAAQRDSVSKEIIRDRYFKLTKEVKGKDADLIVWPEGVLAEYGMEEERIRRRLESIPRQNRAIFMAGMPSTSKTGTYNSVYVLSQTGKVIGQYDKVHLVPYFEEYKSGKRSPVIDTSIGKLGMGICFESIYPEIVRKTVESGAEILFILTNDAGFGNSKIVDLHAREAVFRAVENRRYVVRAAQSGISMIIDPMGRVLSETKEFEKTILTGNVEALKGESFYTKFGDVFAYLCIAGCAIFLVIRLLRAPTKSGTRNDRYNCRCCNKKGG